MKCFDFQWKTNKTFLNYDFYIKDIYAWFTLLCYLVKVRDLSWFLNHVKYTEAAFVDIYVNPSVSSLQSFWVLWDQTPELARLGICIALYKGHWHVAYTLGDKAKTTLLCKLWQSVEVCGIMFKTEWPKFISLFNVVAKTDSFYRNISLSQWQTK